jgi:hypothetical protein
MDTKTPSMNTPEQFSLATTSSAIEAACVLTLDLKSNGYGADTLESFDTLLLDFCRIFHQCPSVSIEEAISFWMDNQDDSGVFSF